MNYLSDEQRRQTGRIGVRKRGVVLTRALSSIDRSMRLIGVLAAVALCILATAAFADSAVTEGSRAAGLSACVAPTDDMRRNHMNYIKHQRVRTVHEGVRGSKFSLVGCVDCHAAVEGGKPLAINSEGQFCRGCHDFTSVSIDCFQCHRGIPSQTAPLRGALPEARGEARMAVELAAPEGAGGLRRSMPMAQED